MEALERRYVLIGLGAVIAVLALLAVIDLVSPEAAPPSRIDLTWACLEDEKLYPVLDLQLSDVMTQARLGGLRAIVEQGNVVRVGITGSEQEAERLAAEVRQDGDVVQVRGDVVLAWDHVPSPTQTRALLDCSY
jgi:hypothetical protein